MPHTLLLLDVDGVLVHPAGYKDALRATVDAFAAYMGHPAPALTYDEIALFEACGLTNEWDSGAMCVSLMLLALLEARPDLHGATFDDTLAALKTAAVAAARPDFAAAARAIAAAGSDGHHPAHVHLDLVARRADADWLPLLSVLLTDVYDVLATPTTRVFQTYTLGSARFAETYGADAPFESESYLVTRDKPLLSAGSRERLLDWHAQPDHGAVVYTARPSLPPSDLPADAAPGSPSTAHSPEAELAAELLNLDGALPLVGQGRVGWLAWRNGRSAAEYVKPSPVQALMAIGTAATGLEMESGLAASTLAEQGDLTGPLAELRGQPVRIIVCEDSTGGIRATRGAVDLLQRAGVDATFQAIGISPNPDKRAALAQVTDQVADDINAGLALALGW